MSRSSRCLVVVRQLSYERTASDPSVRHFGVPRNHVNILIVEDDNRLAQNVERALLLAGHRADIAADGAAALEEVAGRAYDVILLDVLLPSLDGFSVCRELRRRHIQTPVLMLTARDAIDDRVHGLDAGADDYLTKPFATEELLARVRALGRRGGVPEGPMRVADLVLDPARHEVHRGERPIELTPREFELLEFLMRHAGQVISRESDLPACLARRSGCRLQGG